MLVYGAGAAFFCLEPEPTQFCRSRSRLRPVPRTFGAGTAQKSGGSATLVEGQMIGGGALFRPLEVSLL